MKNFLLFMPAIIFGNVLCSQALSLTGFHRHPSANSLYAGADAVFSDAFEIYGIDYFPDKDGPGAVRLPLSYGLDGRDYANVRITDKALFSRLADVFSGGLKKQKSGKTGAPVFEAVSARKLSSPVRIANVDVAFDNEIVVTFGLLRISRKKRNSQDKTVYYRVIAPDSFRFLSGDLSAGVKNAVISAGLKTAVND